MRTRFSTLQPTISPTCYIIAFSVPTGARSLYMGRFRIPPQGAAPTSGHDLRLTAIVQCEAVRYSGVAGLFVKNVEGGQEVKF